MRMAGAVGRWARGPRPAMRERLDSMGNNGVMMWITSLCGCSFASPGGFAAVPVSHPFWLFLERGWALFNMVYVEGG